MRAWSCVDATNVTQIGNAISATPKIMMACDMTVSHGRFSTMRGPRASVMHLALDVAELDHGQRDDDQHEHDGLRGRAAKVEAAEAVVVDLEHQDLGRLGRTAGGHRVDDAKSLKEGVNHVDHK